MTVIFRHLLLIRKNHILTEKLKMRLRHRVFKHFILKNKKTSLLTDILKMHDLDMGEVILKLGIWNLLA